MMPTLRYFATASLALALALAACGNEPVEQPAPATPTAQAPASAEATAGAITETTLIPDSVIGVWDYEKGTCDPASDMRLAIGQDRFEFYESVGEVKAVRREGEATVVDLAMAGEGETWDQSLRLVLRDGGERLQVTEPGSASDTDDYPRKRCPA